jgi:hypothetical protein
MNGNVLLPITWRSIGLCVWTFVVFVMIGIASPWALAQAHRAAASVPDIGGRRQFWFNAQGLIAESALIRVVQERPVKNANGPILVADKPWEGTLVQLYSTDVRYDANTGRWQMWYEGHPGSVLLCTAFSRDGIHWDKPALGIEEWRGSKDNNIILQTGYTDAHAASLVVSPTERDPAKKYKLYYWVGPQWADSQFKPMGLDADQIADAKRRLAAYPVNGHYVAFSPDGVHFTPQTKAPAVNASDYCTVLFDSQSGRYRSYHKTNIRKPGWSEDRRAMAMSESDDGVTFGASQVVLVPDEVDDAVGKSQFGAKRVEYYGVHVWPHEGFYLGLLWVFTVTGGNDQYGRGWDDGKIQPHLIYSPDGVSWSRLPVREPFIPVGPAGSFDSGTLYSSGNGPSVVGDKMRFYYFGCDYTHGNAEPIQSPKNYSGVSFATLPRDRYIGWHGGTVAGTLTTKPFTFTGSALYLNLDASRGATGVALLDADGKPLPGYGIDDCEALSTDGFDQRITWRGRHDLAPLSGKPVRLQFSLRHSVLYTWRFK